MSGFLERQFDDPARARTWKRVGIAACVLIVVAEVVAAWALRGAEHYFAFEGWPAWGSVYGLVSCVAIVLVSKWIGKAFLMRPDEEDDDA